MTIHPPYQNPKPKRHVRFNGVSYVSYSYCCSLVVAAALVGVLGAKVWDSSIADSVESITSAQAGQAIKLSAPIKPKPAETKQIPIKTDPLLAHMQSTLQMDTAQSQEYLGFIDAASKESGIERSLILAVLEKETGHSPGSPFGMVKIRIPAHPNEAKVVSEKGINTDSVQGRVLMTALLLANYKSESMGNVDLALQKFHGAADDKSMSYAHQVTEIEKSLTNPK